MEKKLSADLFAGVTVSDLPRAIAWFEQLLGDVAWFDPNETERVWTINEHAYVYALLAAADAGHAHVTIFVDDLEGFLAAAADRGLEPTSRERYDNGVGKAIFHDPDGNEIGVGGAVAG